MNRKSLDFQITSCTNCPLHAGNGPFTYVGPDLADIVVLGGSFTAAGKPMTPEQGTTLFELLKGIDIDPKAVGYSNAIHCHAPQGVDEVHLAACSGNRTSVIGHTHAKAVLLLGAVPLHGILPGHPTPDKVRGRPFQVTADGPTYFATYNPNLVATNPIYVNELRRDFALFRQVLDAGTTWPDVAPLTCTTCGAGAWGFDDVYLPLCANHHPLSVAA